LYPKGTPYYTTSSVQLGHGHLRASLASLLPVGAKQGDFIPEVFCCCLQVQTKLMLMDF
jgi:hypothetical protein